MYQGKSVLEVEVWKLPLLLDHQLVGTEPFDVGTFAAGTSFGLAVKAIVHIEVLALDLEEELVAFFWFAGPQPPQL